MALGAPDRRIAFAVPTGNFGNVFEEAVDKFGDNIAIEDETRKVTYRELDALANRFGAWARSRNLRRSDVVGLRAELDAARGLVDGQLAAYADETTELLRETFSELERIGGPHYRLHRSLDKGLTPALVAAARALDAGRQVLVLVPGGRHPGPWCWWRACRPACWGRIWCQCRHRPSDTGTQARLLRCPGDAAAL